MKKILLIAATTTTLLTSVASFAGENQFYLKAEAGASKLNKVKYDSYKFKSKTSAIFGVGVGYYVMDNVRADLTLDFLANPEFKNSRTVNGVAYKSKIKSDVTSLLLSGYVDLYDAGIAKFFAGAGVGLAQVKDKLNVTAAGVSDSCKTKKVHNFTYQLSAGASANVSEGVNIDLTYSFRDYGKSKKAKDSDFGKIAHKGHNVIAGIRFDI